MRIALIGSSGRMGQAVKQVVDDTSHEIVAGFDVDNMPQKNTLSNCDVLIDFSTATALKSNLKVALQAGKPFVTGTTGWYDDIEEIKDEVKKAEGSFLYASNFSIGILLFHKLLSRAAELYGSFESYDFALHEIHHNQKEDSPSGTALTLAKEVLINVPGKEDLQVGNPDGKIPKDKLNVSSSRVGHVPGTHTLFIDSLQDTVEITHRAHGRVGFAAGAVKAAEWLIAKKGFYTMDDMLRTMVK